MFGKASAGIGKVSACVATCECGDVKVRISRAPDFINDCNCTLCTFANGAWGYFKTGDVRVTGKTIPTVRTDRPDPIVELQACVFCGVFTHWVLTSDYRKTSGVTDRMGVNMRLFAAVDLIGVEVRFPDGAAWSGEGEYTYRKPSFILGSEG